MNIFNLQFSQFLVAGYIPNQNIEFPPLLDLPQLPHLISLERFLLLALLILLFMPLLKKQENAAQENRRINIIKLAAVIGMLAILIRIYRYLWGLN